MLRMMIEWSDKKRSYLVIIWGKWKPHATFVLEHIRTRLSRIQEFDVLRLGL